MPAAPAEDVRRAVIAARVSSRMVWQKWRDGEAARAMAAAFANDDPTVLAAGLRDLLADDAWVAAILTPLADALARDRFLEPPFKVSRDDAHTSAILYDCPHGSLIATVTSARAMAMRPPAGTVIVPGRMSICRYHRVGGARLLRWRMSGERAVPVAPVDLSDGMVVAFDGRAEAQMLAGAAHDVVSITATIRLGQAAVMREYDRASGRPLRAATLDEGGARSQMLLALLRASGRADAAPAFDRASRDPAAFVRWDAMRQWLATDAAAALPRLDAMAAHDADPDIRRAAIDTAARTRALLQAASCPG